MNPTSQRDEPCIFFHAGYWWSKNTDPILVNCQSINEEAARPLLTSLKVKVSKPDVLLEWLDKNDAAFITDLHVIIEAYRGSSAVPPARWTPLFEKLGREATNLQNLKVHWDHFDFIHPGLGTDLGLVRALTQLKVKNTLEISGYYAQPWPSYLERKMGLKPLETENKTTPGFRGYQRGTENLIP